MAKVTSTDILIKVARNAHVQYETSSTHCSKVSSKLLAITGEFFKLIKIPYVSYQKKDNFSWITMVKKLFR